MNDDQKPLGRDSHACRDCTCGTGRLGLGWHGKVPGSKVRQAGGVSTAVPLTE